MDEILARFLDDEGRLKQLPPKARLPQPRLCVFGG
jgi:hypothetical protein